MKYKNILIIMIITILFTGCSASQKDELLNEGKLALERHEYTKAQELLSQALTADSTNENARSMYIQAVKMKDAAEYEEKKKMETISGVYSDSASYDGNKHKSTGGRYTGKSIRPVGSPDGCGYRAYSFWKK